MKNSFVLYTDYMKHLQLLTLEQRGLLFTAIMLHQSGNVIPEMDPATHMAFSFISADMDSNNEKYNRTVEARREAGRKGAEAKQAKAELNKQTEAKSANASFAKTEEANEADNDNDNDNDLKNIYGDSRPSDKELGKEFDELWGMYPRKCGDRKKARNNYIKGRKSKVLPVSYDDVKRGIEAYKRQIEEDQIDPQYVMYGSTFFNGRRWMDDFTVRTRAPNKWSAGMETHDYDWKELEKDLLA